LNNGEKLNEKMGIEMLWEAISSDDDIAMDTDEDGALVLPIHTLLLSLFYWEIYVEF